MDKARSIVSNAYIHYVRAALEAQTATTVDEITIFVAAPRFPDYVFKIGDENYENSLL
jgi:hypothetical protein